jgi:hypothetical protein
MKRLLVVLLFLSAAVPAARSDQAPQTQSPEKNREDGAEPPSQADVWRQQRAEKLRRIAPYRQGGLESGLLWFETKGIKLLSYSIFGFRPKIGGLPTGGGFALGTQFHLPNPSYSRPDLDGTAVWSMRGYQRYQIKFGKHDREDRGALLYADLRYRKYPQEDFFGLGPRSTVRDRTDFSLEDVTYDGVIGYRAARWLESTFRFGYMQVNVDTGTDRRFPDTHRLFNDTTAPGLAEQPSFFHWTYSLTADGRDVPGNPHKGGSVRGTFSRFNDVDRHAFSFDRVAVDADGYLPLGSTVRVLAVHFYGSGDRAEPGSRVPFYMQETLGGSESLRGFREYRFRDRYLFYLSGEYRWEPVRAVELALFYDTGKVFSRRDELDFTGLSKSAGIGIRFKTAGGVVLRVDAARSREGTRIYFKFTPSFKDLSLRDQ